MANTLASRTPHINTDAENAAVDLLLSPRRAFQNLLTAWQEGIDLIWDAEDPQAVFTALGSDAALLVEDSTATIHFLESRVKGSTTDRLIKIRPFTVNGNGTVTVN